MKKARRREMGLFPGSAAAVHQTAFQGERKRAYVELLPLRVDNASGTVTLARRLLVRLEFTGRVKGETGEGDKGRRVPRSLRRDSGSLLARLVTRE